MPPQTATPTVVRTAGRKSRRKPNRDSPAPSGKSPERQEFQQPNIYAPRRAPLTPSLRHDICLHLSPGPLTPSDVSGRYDDHESICSDSRPPSRTHLQDRRRPVTPARGRNRKAALETPVINLDESSEDERPFLSAPEEPLRSGKERLTRNMSNSTISTPPRSLSPAPADASTYFQRTTQSFARTQNCFPERSPMRQSTTTLESPRDSPLRQDISGTHSVRRKPVPAPPESSRGRGKARSSRTTKIEDHNGETVVTVRESPQNLRNSGHLEVEPIEFVASSRPLQKSECPAKRTFVSSSRETSFESMFGGRTQSTAPTTAPSSFQESKVVPTQMEDDFEEIPTDVDEELLDPPRPGKEITKAKEQLSRQKIIDLEIALEQERIDEYLEVMELEYLEEEQLDMEAAAQRRSSYDPDSEEERLIQYPELPDLDPWEEEKLWCEAQDDYGVYTDDEYEIASSVAHELSMMNLDPTPEVDLTGPLPEGGRTFDRFPLFVQHEVARIGLELGFPLDECNTKVARFAERYGVDLFAKSQTFDEYVGTFRAFGKALARAYPMQTQSVTITPMTDTVWVEFKKSKDSWPDSLQFSGRLDMISHNGSDIDFQLRLNPLSTAQGHRLGFRFGHDRFMTLRIPYPKEGSEEIPPSLRGYKSDELRTRIAFWLEKTELNVMNRKWRCFYIRDGQADKKVGGIKIRNNFLRAFFFAESGTGLGRKVSLMKKIHLRCADRLPGNREQERADKTVRELIEWVLPLDRIMDKLRREEDPAKRGGMFAKAWSRISLSLSTARPTVTFSWSQIKIVEDTMGDYNNALGRSEVMNDGCSVCSPAVMRKIRDELGLETTPSAVQGRLGGAKGMWFVDPNPNVDWGSEDLWIRITKSQLKYDFHENQDRYPDTADWARLTLFVVKTSKKPSSAHLNSQLIPIMQERGVKRSVFEELLKEDLEEGLDWLIRSAKDRIELRQWLSGPGGMVRERDGNGEIRMYRGGMPMGLLEKITAMIEAEFEPEKCRYLVELLAKVVESRCNAVMDRTHINVPQSTTVFCIADPTGTLAEGEIFLQFGPSFVDEKEKLDIGILEGNVLVARNPAHLPTDIQKVRAVCPTVRGSEGLRRLRNVAVFSTQGDFPLAGMLSGGDYDGDMVWVTWDPHLVTGFKNSNNKVYLRDITDRYFEKMPLSAEELDPNPNLPEFSPQFLIRGFTIAMNENLTGYCTRIWQKYIYSQGSKIHLDRNVFMLAKFCGIFVDAAKQGLVPKPETCGLLHGMLDPLANIKCLYKDPTDKSRPSKPLNEWFILDYLVFHVAKQVGDGKKIEYDDFRNSSGNNHDMDVTGVYNTALAAAEAQKKHGNPVPMSILNDLDRKLVTLQDMWIKTMAGKTEESDSFGQRLEARQTEYNEIRPPMDILIQHSKLASWMFGWSYSNPSSDWEKLKASRLFSLCSGKSSKLPWWMAFRTLCELKAMAVAKRCERQWPRVVAADMYLQYKPAGKSKAAAAQATQAVTVAVGGRKERVVF